MNASIALKTLTEHLANTQYAFVCPSPETQDRVVKKRRCNASTSNAATAVDLFGWNLAITKENLDTVLPGHVRDMLVDSGILQMNDAHLYNATVRISNLYLPEGREDGYVTPLYYIHSSFPTSPDSVFFGPDTYLFLKLLRDVFRPRLPPKSIIDVCCGSGAGAIHMARTYPEARTVGLDLNTHALQLGVVNSELSDAPVEFFESGLYGSLPDEMKTSGVDLIVSNPPYIASSSSGKDLPIYANGGTQLGLGISLRIVEEGIKLLASGGNIVVYTGVAISAARPAHDDFLQFLCGLEEVSIEIYTVLQPDMWSEEIGSGAYANACRIQVVGAVLTKK